MKQELELSFVDASLMNTICTPTAFDNAVTEAESHPIKQDDGSVRKMLCNYDFSQVDFTEVKKRDFTGWIIKNVIFSKPSIDKESKKLINGFSFVGAKLERVVFAHAQLVRCNFDSPDLDAINKYLIRANSEKNIELKKYYDDCMTVPENERKAFIQTAMNEVDFFFADLKLCRFRSAIITAADFRYSTIKDCTMRESVTTYGDFYSCTFKGTTTFQKSIFNYCSITNAIFEQQCLRMNNIRNGILQSDVNEYNKMVMEYPRWYRYNPCMNFSAMLHEHSAYKIYSEAQEVYRQLSGIYAGKGLNRDSNRAYKEYIDYDLKQNWYGIGANWKEKNYKECCNNISNLVGDILTIVCGYGYMGWVVVIWFGILVSSFALLCYAKKHEAVDSLSYSLSNSLGPFEEYYNTVQGVLPSIESVIGVLLVGFLGFIIANKIRNNS